jgi:predicted transcriptional regulator
LKPHDETLVAISMSVVAAYVANNPVPANELSGLIRSTHESIRRLETPAEPTVELTPAVSPKKSVHNDYLICLDDGKRFKSLKRHIGKLGMTPEEYRTKWGLPTDYPMVAPAYSAARSQLAKDSGLGRSKHNKRNRRAHA